MSRSGYVIDENNKSQLYRGAVRSAIKGKRGQKLLSDILSALDAMWDKKLSGDHLNNPKVFFCTLGVLGSERGLYNGIVDNIDHDALAEIFDASPALVREIMFVNDECGSEHTCLNGVWKYSDYSASDRWARMRKWVESKIS